MLKHNWVHILLIQILQDFLLTNQKLSSTIRYSMMNNMNKNIRNSLLSKRNSIYLNGDNVIYLFIWLFVCVHLSYQVLSSLPIDKTRSLPSLFCLPNVRIVLSLSLSLHFCVRISASPTHLHTLPLMKGRDVEMWSVCECVCDNYRMLLKRLVTFIWVDTVNLLKWVSLRVNIRFPAFD